MKKSFHLILVFIPLFFILLSAQNQSRAQAISEIVKRSNVIYTEQSFQTGIPHIPPLVSNGIVGGCFDHMGFQSHPNYDYPHGRTVFGYIRNYDRHESSRQIQFPMAIIQAEFKDGGSILNFMDCEDYKQELDIYSGVLTTEYDLYGKTKIIAFAHQTIPNLFIMKINRTPDSDSKKILLKIQCETSEAQNNYFNWHVNPIQLKFDKSEIGVKIKSTTDLGVTNWIIKTNNAVEVDRSTVIIPLNQNENELRIYIERNDCPGKEVLNAAFDELFESHTAEWKRIWNTSWVNFPEERAQNIWMRTKYYALSHFPVIPEKPLIPTGLNSNIWGFTFPQDVYYVAENLPRLGHFHRSEKALQYWLDILPEVKKYTRRIMHVDGAFYPWTPPFTDWDSYEKEGVVSPDSYELHNPAYVATMIWHYYLISQDENFLANYFSIIEEVFRFYNNISVQNENGTFDVYHENARGQDEASTTEGKLRNLLCASYSAEYSARIYRAAAEIIDSADLELLAWANHILNTGYERDILLRPEGFYRSYQGDDRPLGSQKHPVQLNPIAYVPMSDLVTEDSPVEKAWKNRYDLTKDARKPMTLGWTIGEFALASCRMRAPGEFVRDLSAIQPCHAADPRWIQFYESSFWEGWHFNKAYYFPMMGLYLQAFTDALVQDWRGYVDLFPCLLPEWKNKSISFHGIHARGGISVSGDYENGRFSVTLTPVSAKEITVRVSQDILDIKAEGQQSGVASFNGNETVKFRFDRKKPITIHYDAGFK